MPVQVTNRIVSDEEFLCDPHSVSRVTVKRQWENAIIYFLDVTQRRQARERLAPFRVERVDFREQDREGFFRGLARNGPKAVEEFRKAFK